MEETLEALCVQMHEINRSIALLTNTIGLDDWVPQKEAEKLTGLSKSTLYSLRKQNELTYSTFTGKKIFYRRSNLIRFLDKREKMKG